MASNSSLAGGHTIPLAVKCDVARAQSYLGCPPGSAPPSSPSNLIKGPISSSVVPCVSWANSSCHAW